MESANAVREIDALGGIMGGEPSSVTEGTTAVFLESALFDPRNIGAILAVMGEHDPETNRLAEHYRRRGYHLSPEIAYLNHLLTYVLAGPLQGLNNRKLFECGADIPGLPRVRCGRKS